MALDTRPPASDRPPADETLAVLQLGLDPRALLLSVNEVAASLRISRWAVYQLINKRRLKTVFIGRRRLVPREDLIALVADLRAEGGIHGL